MHWDKRCFARFEVRQTSFERRAPISFFDKGSSWNALFMIIIFFFEIKTSFGKESFLGQVWKGYLKDMFVEFFVSMICLLGCFFETETSFGKESFLGQEDYFLRKKQKTYWNSFFQWYAYWDKFLLRNQNFMWKGKNILLENANSLMKALFSATTFFSGRLKRRPTSNRCVLPPKVEFTDLVVCSVFFLGVLFRPLKWRREKNVKKVTNI